MALNIYMAICVRKANFMEQNICKFIPVKHFDNKIDIINFVYETQCIKYEKKRLSAVYSMNLVTEGEGIFEFDNRRYILKKGDIFFVFPSTPYNIISKKSLKYIYISYIGIRSNKIMDTIKITKTSPYFEKHEKLINFWTEALQTAHLGNIEMLSESVLLYTFSIIGNTAAVKEDKASIPDMSLKIKKYIDENFFDADLSLDLISKKYSYNPKYISTAFKKQMQISFKQYLNTIRIQKACELMTEGLTCIKDIAYMCGFKDQMYFSKVFKKKIGVTPSEHIEFLKIYLN